MSLSRDTVRALTESHINSVSYCEDVPSHRSPSHRGRWFTVALVLVAFALLVFSGIAHAQSKWMLVGDSGESQVHLDIPSLAYFTTPKGLRLVQGTLRHTMAGKQSTVVGYVHPNQCEKGAGKLLILNGSTIIMEGEYKLAGNRVMDTTALALCYYHEAFRNILELKV